MSQIHDTAPTRYVEADGVRFASHGSFYPSPQLFVAHTARFLDN